jgi:hypothetical protein
MKRKKTSRTLAIAMVKGAPLINRNLMKMGKTKRIEVEKLRWKLM